MTIDERIALRLPSEQRQMIDQLVKEGKYPTISSVIREALRQFLEKN